MREQSDAAVVGESLERPAAFSALYERHLDTVARYVARRVGASLAEDLTAEVFVRAFRARMHYRPERATALPWLLGIAGHVVADNRRAERRRLAALEQLAADAALAAPRGDNQLSAGLVRRLRALPSRDRDALLLVVWGGALLRGGRRGARGADRHRPLTDRPRPRQADRGLGHRRARS